MPIDRYRTTGEHDAEFLSLARGRRDDRNRGVPRRAHRARRLSANLRPRADAAQGRTPAAPERNALRPPRQHLRRQRHADGRHRADDVAVRRSQVHAGGVPDRRPQPGGHGQGRRAAGEDHRQGPVRAEQAAGGPLHEPLHPHRRQPRRRDLPRDREAEAAGRGRLAPERALLPDGLDRGAHSRRRRGRGHRARGARSCATSGFWRARTGTSARSRTRGGAGSPSAPKTTSRRRTGSTSCSRSTRTSR